MASRTRPCLLFYFSSLFLKDLFPEVLHGEVTSTAPPPFYAAATTIP
jgi:hypothetical protein